MVGNLVSIVAAHTINLGAQKRRREEEEEDRTAAVHTWMKGLSDDEKMRFALNWKMPGSVFNTACKMYPGGGAALQGIDWYQIHKSRDLGTWSHGGKVYVL